MKIDQHLIDAVVEADAASRKARRALSDAIVAASPFKVGDIVRKKRLGHMYRIVAGSAGFLGYNGRPTLTLVGHRVYGTKRPDARSPTYLNDYDLELVPGPSRRRTA